MGCGASVIETPNNEPKPQSAPAPLAAAPTPKAAATPAAQPAPPAQPPKPTAPAAQPPKPTAPAGGKKRYNTLRDSPAGAKYKLCVVQFKVKGAKNGGSDKGPDGNRVDSIPIANSVIEAGGACELILYDAEDHAAFVSRTAQYDALIVRINPGQLSQGTPEGTQQKFDDLMNQYISDGKLVWSSPKIQTQMGAKDALVKIGHLNCGLEDTYAYYNEDDLVAGFKKCCAFQPRVIKQNRGSAGEGIWLCWLWDKEKDCKIEIYPSKSLGEVSLGDDDYLKLMEMNDNHVEKHTVKEFMIFCVGGPNAEGAGTWTSTFPGEYLKGGKAAGGQLVDQRLLPRIDEGEVRILMAGDTCQMAVHKKPMGGGLSAVGGNSEYTYYEPTDAKYKGLIGKLYADIPTLLPSLDLAGEPLPLLWTCDYIPKNPDDWEKGPYDRSCPDNLTEYTVGEFNCSCVGISKFQAVCGGEKTLADVPDEDYYDACRLTDLMGVKAIEMLGKRKAAPPAAKSTYVPPAGAKRYNTLRDSPAGAKYKLCVVQFKVKGAKNGGSDKGPDGNRVDSIPIANSVIEAGGACELILYDAEDHAAFVSRTAQYDALIVRINPGQLSQGTPEGTQQKFDDLMNQYISEGKLVWSSPKIQTQMGAKDALVKIGHLNCGLEDTYAYYNEDELVAGFKKCCAFQPRVIKQNRGSAGEGIWLCWLWDKEKDCKIEIYPSKSLGEVSLGDDDYLKLMEMNDNHVEKHTVKEFMIFCVGGPNAEGAGTWTSTFPGEYLKGGKAAGGQLVDQRLLPRIDEGEVRILMAGDTCQMAVHKKPMGGGLSAVGGNSEYTYYEPTDAKYKGLIGKLYADIPTLLPSLDLAGEPLPLLWTCDYIPKNPDDWEKGPYDRSCPDDLTEYTVGEFNCSCVGISKFQAVCGGEKTLADVPDEDYYDACRLTDLMGVKAIEMLGNRKAAPPPAAPAGGKMRYNTLRDSPAGAKYKLCVVQFKVNGAKNGGSDKGPDGNRVDSIPIANSVIEAGGACELILYDAEDHDGFVSTTAQYDALIVRINPGQLSQGTPEGTQQKFDDLMNQYISEGKLVWSSPKIQTQMGAKDALVKIGHLNCGLEDTYAYYNEDELVAGFKKCCAFQPRVIKQNRGSAGEGIWLCWLWDKEKDEKIEIYPAKSLGEVSLGDDDYLKLMEMNDNHVEKHTVKEFMIFCVGGPNAEGAGTWTSTFPGEYLKGGKAAGGQLVDQRLLPRIDEGEVRILMAGDTCQMAVHKKPMGGGLSAVGGNSEYTYYEPTDAKYEGLIGKLYADIPTLLPSLDLAGEPLPLLWTCDYIPKNPDDWEKGPYDRSCPDDLTEYTVGEFNCSCVGISKFQAVCGGEKTLADVPDEDYYDACRLTDLMGVKAIEMLEKARC